MIVLGIALAAAVTLISAAVPMLLSTGGSPVVTAAPTSVPAAVPTAVIRTAAPAPVSTAVPVQAGPSRTINTENDLDVLVKWMIQSNQLNVKLDALNISEDQIKNVLSWNPEVDRYTWSVISLELKLSTGTKVLSAINRGDVASLSAEEQEFARKAQQIVASLIQPGMSDLEKEIAIHDYIIYNCDYEINPALHTEDCRGFFNHGRVQCSGYSDMFRLLGGLCGLEIRSITGEEIGKTGGHEWNLIRLDGLWYAVDVTWDDPLGGNAETYIHLNIPHRMREEKLVFDHRALPEGTLAQNYDRNFYYAYRGIAASNIAEAEQLLRSQLATGKRAEVCSIIGEMDISALMKKIMSERGTQVSWNIGWWEGTPGVVLYEITIN